LNQILIAGGEGRFEDGAPCSSGLGAGGKKILRRRPGTSAKLAVANPGEGGQKREGRDTAALLVRSVLHRAGKRCFWKRALLSRRSMVSRLGGGIVKWRGGCGVRWRISREQDRQARAARSKTLEFSRAMAGRSGFPACAARELLHGIVPDAEKYFRTDEALARSDSGQSRYEAGGGFLARGGGGCKKKILLPIAPAGREVHDGSDSRGDVSKMPLGKASFSKRRSFGNFRPPTGRTFAGKGTGCAFIEEKSDWAQFHGKLAREPCQRIHRDEGRKIIHSQTTPPQKRNAAGTSLSRGCGGRLQRVLHYVRAIAVGALGPHSEGLGRFREESH